MMKKICSTPVHDRKQSVFSTVLLHNSAVASITFSILEYSFFIPKIYT